MRERTAAPRGVRIAARVVVPAVLSVLAMLVAGAAAAPASPDAHGAPPPGGVRRVVSLVPSVTETVFALDRGDRLVGISTFCDYPPEAVRGIPRAGSYLTPSVETIVALRPDVVIGVPTPGNQAAVEQLRGLGIHVVIVGEQTLADTWQAIRTIGRWVGNEDGAAALVARLEGQIEAVRAKAARAPRRKVLFVVGHDPLVAAGSGLFIDELIEVAGGTNVAAATGATWPRLSLETVVAAAPDVIVDGAMGTEADDGLAAYWRPYASVPAVRAGRVRAQRSDALLRPGPRVGKAAEELYALIHDDGGAPGEPAAPRPASGGQGGA